MTKVLQEVLESLESIHPGNMTPMAEKAWTTAIEALRKALSQQGEPCDMGQMCLNCQPRGPNGECPDKAAPAAQPLTMQEIIKLTSGINLNAGVSWVDLVRAVERAHGIGAKPAR